MEFNDWLTARGFDPATVTETQRPTLQAQWRLDQRSTDTTKDDDFAARLKAAVDKELKTKGEVKVGDASYEEKLAAIDAENERQDYIRDVTMRALQANVGNAEKCKQIRGLCESAIADTKTDKRSFDLGMLRLDRYAGPTIFAPSKPQVTDEVVEAAVCVTHKLPNVEKTFNERTLESAHKAFPRGVTLKRLMMLGAQANGYRGDDGDWYAVCRAAMAAQTGYDVRADVGPSTGVQVPGILSNIANKFLAASFMNVDQSWRGIAKVRPVNDFKQVTTYRMSGNNTFLRVSPSGEIKHGALAETSYTNQAKTFGRMLGISREDYINDDLGAFASVTQELGRGAADGLNNIFWAAFLDDSTFFPTDKSKLNYDDGATDSVLSLAGLDNAESIFAVQTKPDGTPLGATPTILLVPSALKNTALTLMQSQITNMATSTVALTGNANIFAGRYKVVASPFLSRTSLNDENGVSQTVTGSSTAWYLLCDPLDISVIEVALLYGKDTPTVETGQFEFDRLGLATRAYFDFGVSRQEYRGGVKLKGAA